MENGKALKMRIYVGGLGEAMTEDDLRRIFQSGGEGVVEAIEIIRTKSRNFAYVDFFPSSQNSLSKIFSVYNGCAWKGGKLRLEKAKEHYPVRLRREWEEDTQLTNNSAGADLESSVAESAEKVVKSEEIQIFFPRLGKVKPLPISGSGTHKYSFPHVEVPPLPVHFCDCEEHNVSAPMGNSEDTKTGGLDAQIVGIDEEEIKLMDAVMNKLFERQKTSKIDKNGTIIVNVRDNSMALTDDQKIEDNKVNSDDDDNLVLNVMANDGNTSTMPFNHENEMVFNAQGSSKDVSKDQKREDRVQNKKRKPLTSESEGVSKDQKRKDRVQIKKRKSITSEDFDTNENVSSFHAGVSVRPYGPQPVDPEKQINSPCAQRSSWKALISDQSSVAFSISHLLPSVPSAGEEQPKSDGGTAHSTPNEDGNFATDAILENKSEEMESMKILDEAQNTTSNVSLNKGRGSSWLQKSSWTQLVGGENNTFNIGLVLPSNTINSNAVNANISAGSKNPDSPKQDELEHRIAEDNSAAFVVRKEDTTVNDVKKDQQPTISRHVPQQTQPNDVKLEETCPFMRNSRSVAEWAKIKAALTGASKRKKQRQ